MEFIRVARVSDIGEKRSLLVYVGGEAIALWRIEGRVYAINNVCPHQHTPSLHQGTLDGLFVTCPMHGWTFSLEDGRPKFGNGRATVYQVKVEGGDVYVEQPKSSW
ncbi:MAG TPA: Rieske 2Fe-2S domain-containing protein [Bacteroidota bacterium]|nr:Rieske 2Fe-2S domain-containing protein [Bacteroidota bacterium]